MQFILAYPWWFIFGCLLLGFLYAYLLYFWKPSSSQNYKGKEIYFLAFLRFIAVSFISFLLLSPLLKTKNTAYDKPILVFAKDNSESLLLKLNKAQQNILEDKWSALIKSLERKYKIVSYNFSAKLEEEQKLNFKGKETDISDVLDEIIGRHSNQNIGAIVLATDGIYNKGINPIYTEAVKICPIFTVALGDTTIQKDLFINGLSHSEIVYLGDQFNLNISIRANYLKDGNSVVQVLDPSGKIVYNTPISINSNDYIWSGNVVLDANKSGVQRYEVKVGKVNGEMVLSNNSSAVYVEVLDGRQKILLLYDAPNPDISALKAVIEQNKNYQFDIKSALEYKGNLSDYGMVILHGLPSKTNKIANVINEITETKKPVLYIMSSDLDIGAFNLAQKTLQISTSGKSSNDVVANFNINFSKFTITPESIRQIESFPPLLAPFGNYKVNLSADIIFNQQIGRIKTDMPLILLDQNLNQRIGIIAGEGIWRWRMENFNSVENYKVFDDFMGKIFQFLSIRGDDRKFKLKTAKHLYAENESVRLDAELFNESFQLVNNEDVILALSSKGSNSTAVMDKVFNAYSIDLGQLPEGNYIATATTKSKGKSLKSTISFSVKPLQIETMRLQADHGMLYDLSKKSGGEMVLLENIDKLEKSILENNAIKPVVYDFYKTRPLLDFKYLFFIALGCLAIEWFLRKYKGGF